MACSMEPPVPNLDPMCTVEPWPASAEGEVKPRTLIFLKFPIIILEYPETSTRKNDLS